MEQQHTGGARDAIVIGGGLAGMLAATALLGHADTVTVIERDRYPEHRGFRKGVPQSRHTHILLTGGQRALDALLPGSCTALVEAGAPRLDLPRDILTRTPTGWPRRFDEGRHHTLSVSRPLLDAVVTERARAAFADSTTHVEVREATEAVGLTGDAERVTGVRIRPRDGGAPQTRTAALVVDASGRSSRAPRWYAELGLDAPHEETVDTGLGYATRRYRPGPGGPPDTGVNIPNWPGSPRGGCYLPVEDGAWMLTLAGMHGDHPPTDPAEFLAYCATVGDPYLHSLVADAEPLTPVHGFQDTRNRRRRYERPGASPHGFLVLGDAHCTFNPVYGQGMSVAALGARALRDTLERTGGPLPDTAATVQREIAAVTDPAWITAVGADLPYLRDADEKRSVGERLTAWYLERLAARAALDPVVGAALRDVFCLTAPLPRLFGPRIAARTVLRPRRPALPAPPTVPEPVRASGARA
ncbi:NAD(P)/FAD-dependent oxidoreductase [Streptomyces catenulae]|uniref:NAD(P)/FAD-dependent oxidoreductase n=1 Tax=Streptomyces catenulae TaxID=66875 RepID=UPI0004C0416C|nr:FAD-dependent monooxygenase [Streptomyces catenulae]